MSSKVLYSPGLDYEAVAASQTDQVLGPSAGGAAGDQLDVLVCTCTGAAVTNTVSIKDGSGGASIPIIPTNAPAGVYNIILGCKSNAGGWRVTTAATVTVLAIGSFS